MKTEILDNFDDMERWDQFVADHPRGSFLQLSHWAEIKRKYGWSYSVIVVTHNNVVVGGCLVLKRVGMFGWTFGYAPYGPIWLDDRDDVKQVLFAELKKYQSGMVVMRLELNILDPIAMKQVEGPLPELIEDDEATDDVLESRRNDEVLGWLATHSWRHLKGMQQPEATNVLNLRQTEEVLMSEMRQTTRRYIRKAEKQQVTIDVDINGTQMDVFYDILKKVNERKKFGIHTKDYYMSVWRQFYPDRNSRSRLIDAQPYLLIAKRQGEYVGAYFMIRMGTSSWELYGGMTESGMQVKANYLLKWRAIQAMKRDGVVWYDQWGVAPLAKSSEGYDQKHPLAGVTYFKEGFGGQRIEYSGSWDHVHSWPIYWAARLLRKL